MGVTVPHTPKQHNEDDEVVISVKLPVDLDEWIRDFQHKVAAERNASKKRVILRNIQSKIYLTSK